MALFFAFIAGVLVGTTASRVGLSLCRSATALAGRSNPYVRAGALIVSFALAAGIFYLAIGSRHSLERFRLRSAASAGAVGGAGKGAAMETEVAGLEARLAREGGTSGDWSLLAQAYDFLGRPEDAKRARAKAGNPASGPAVSQMGAGATTAAAGAAESGPSATGRVASMAPPAVSAADLERRVAANPGDAKSWLALGDLRRGQRDWASARAAYVRLVDLRAMSAQSWADYADVLGSLAGGSLNGEAGRAIDHALALDAANHKALWLRASQANEQGRFAEALAWWKKLRQVLPPDSADARIVDANIAEATSLATPATAVPTGPVTTSAGTADVYFDKPLAATRGAARARAVKHPMTTDMPGGHVSRC